MKSHTHTLFAGLPAVATLVFLAQSAAAQVPGVPPTVTMPGMNVGVTPGVVQPALQPAENILRIRQLTDIRRDFAQRATPLGNRSGKQRTWGVFDATFDTAPDWMDISVTYTVMLDNERAPQGEKRMSLYTASFDYPDIQMGRDRKVGVVLPPGALLRHGNPIGFAVQFSIGGRPAGEMGVGEGLLRGRDRWWADSQITGSQLVQRREGLMERSKSPFALVDIDSYEIAK